MALIPYAGKDRHERLEAIIPAKKPGGRPRACGVPIGNKRKIAVCFDDDAFGAIQRLATRNGVAFAEQVRRLVDQGLAELLP